MNRSELEVMLIKKAWANPDYRKELLANARAVIERELDQKLPDGLEINVIEETASKVYIVLPLNPADARSEAVVPGGTAQIF